MKVSDKLGLGTVQFGLSYGISNKKGKTSDTEVAEILDLAKFHGIDLLDSASAYGNAEEVLGQNKIDDFKMVSKFMPPSDGSRISDQLYHSMRILGLNSLYGYLAHRPLEILNQPEQWEELQHFKAEGTVKKIGFSLNEPKELEPLLNRGCYPDLVQVPYNYFDRRFEDAIISLKEKGCEIHTRSAFLQGLFFIDPGELPEFFKEVKPLLISLQRRLPLNGALLKFLIEKPFIDKIIIGVESKLQLLQNLAEIKNSPSLPQLNEKISDNILIPSRWPKN